MLALINRFWSKRDKRADKRDEMDGRTYDERQRVTEAWYTEVIGLRKEMGDMESRFERRSTQYEARITELETRLDQLREANTSLRIQSADTQGKLDALQVSYTALQIEHGALKAEHLTLKVQYEAVLTELAEMRSYRTPNGGGE